MTKKQLITRLEKIVGKNWGYEDIPSYIRQNQLKYSANCWEFYKKYSKNYENRNKTRFFIKRHQKLD